MRILVDMQRAQRALVEPGLGDFDLKLAQYLARTRGDHEVVLLVSDLHAGTIEPLRELFRAALGVDAVRAWYCLPLARRSDETSDWRLACARLLKEAAVLALRPDVFIVPVQGRDGGIDEAAIPVFPALVSTLAVVEQPAGAHTDTNRRVAAMLEEFGFVAAYEELPGAPAPAGGRHACVEIAMAQLARTAADLPDAARVASGPTAVAGLWDTATALLRDRLAAAGLARDGAKPRLAYVSPLPPERSGIADYSAVLLPALSRYYQIDVVASQASVSDQWVAQHCPLISPAMFEQTHADYQRVLYHFGNSPFHDYMFDLLAVIPGVVVLHDFYLGDIQLIREQRGLAPHAWTWALYAGHGYRALMHRFDEQLKLDTLSRYPANFEVLQQAQGCIVHSAHARRLAADFYGQGFPADCAVIPLARKPQPPVDRAQTRAKLGFAVDEFVVCSFGVISRAKLHDRILAAWRQSGLARDAKCRLVFVGALLFVGGADEAYGAALQRAIKAAGLTGSVQITGWVDGATYHEYLAAADLAVQLRAQSRGETSAAVLDCMSYALATIVNANGSLADLPADTVERLPDEFTDAQLASALEGLWRRAESRRQLGARAKRLIDQHHAPEVCALEYSGAIEKFAARASVRVSPVARAIGAATGSHATDAELAALALGLTKSVPLPTATRQLLVDVSAIRADDLKTGIQRVVRALVWEFIQEPPAGFRVEPVYMSRDGGTWHYRYARAWTCNALGILGEWASNDAAEFGAGDVLLVADFTSGLFTEAQRCGLLQSVRDAGVTVNFTVYDLLPIQMPQMFPPGTGERHAQWVQAGMAAADRAVCISKAVADDLGDYVESVRPPGARRLKIDWFHLGADLDGSIPTGGMPEGSAQVLAALRARPSFLMVGTVEPRKGHEQGLAGFEALWSRGHNVNLVVVGKRGWMMDRLSERMRTHPEAGKRLFWIEGASDEYLQALYGAALCLFAASEGEGFGLPLIEAAQHGLPIIARDIPVFREVAGDHASYFSGDSGEVVADNVQAWLQRWEAGTAPHSEGMPWLTWRQSAKRMLQCLELDAGATAGHGGPAQHAAQAGAVS